MGIARFNQQQLLLLEKILEKLDDMREILNGMEQNSNRMKESLTQWDDWEDEEEESVEDGAEDTANEGNIPTEVEEIVHTTIPEDLREIVLDHNKILNENTVVTMENAMEIDQLIVVTTGVYSKKIFLLPSHVQPQIPNPRIMLFKGKKRISENLTPSTSIFGRLVTGLWIFDPGIHAGYFSITRVHPLSHSVYYADTKAFVTGIHPKPCSKEVVNAPIVEAVNDLKLFKMLETHGDRVWSLAWDPTVGTPLVFAPCSSDKAVRIWEHTPSPSATWTCKAILEDTHTRTVCSCAKSPLKKLLATVSFDATISNWENVDGDYEGLSTLKGHENATKRLNHNSLFVNLAANQDLLGFRRCLWRRRETMLPQRQAEETFSHPRLLSVILLQDGRDTIWPLDFHTGWSYGISIPSWIFLSRSRGSDPVVFYRIQVGTPEGINTIRGILRGFNDFLKLFSEVKKAFPSKYLPPALPKNMLKIKSRTLLEERRCFLEDWRGKLFSDIDVSRSAPVPTLREFEAVARSSFYDENQQTPDVNSSTSGVLQLNADKSPFQRMFVNQVKRCAEMSRKLRFFKDQISKAGLLSSARPVMQPDVELEELEIQLVEHENELIEMNANGEKLRQSYNELLEFKIVLQKAGSFLVSSGTHAVSERELDENVYSNDDYVDTASLLEQELGPGISGQSGLRFISGIISKSQVLRFERMLFRATRGNMLFNQAPADEEIMDPVSSEMVAKTVFVVFFSGEQAKSKILKICEAFGANFYPVPENITNQRQITREVSLRLDELEATLDAGIRHRNKALASIGFHLVKWISMVRREKAVYDTLSMLNFDVTKKCLVGEGWCPIFAKAQLQAALQRATFDSNSQVGIIFHVMDAAESPPTYFRTNKFTNAFQEIVDAYGVARYQESNPSVYTVITFPFLFAVMFGDWGHGICLLLGALVLIARESKLGTQKLGSFMEMLYGGRYVLLLMSLFSIYCGLIYNEFFSVPYHIFGPSAYKCRDTTCSEAKTTGLVKYQDPYPFGVDPSWRGSRSELPFLNSLKMKMSILLGVAQMNMGIILSYFNACFFGSSLDIRYQFVPQIIFLNSLFGYLSLLIIIKWCTGSQADLYHVMIYMFLSPTEDLGENQLFWGQRPLQIILLLLAMIAVPWMLFPKPFILKRLHTERFQGRTYGILGTSEMDLEVEPDSARQHQEDFNFSEVFVHQMIHSIEFVLGAVSNTASYLRLWALSLAHSELSTVFYEKVLLLAWGYDNLVIQLVGLAVFAFATAFILLMMETLSAFLHALRLHWVEFQNKFYHGDGYKFRPFSFATLTEDED